MCIWKNDPIEILDVPEDKPIVAYKYLKRSYVNPDLLKSPVRFTRWALNKRVSSRTADPLTNAAGDPVGIYAFASFKAAQSKVLYPHSRVVVKVHLWGKVAVQAGERKYYDKYRFRHPGYPKHDSRFKGYRAQHAKMVKVYA